LFRKFEVRRHVDQSSLESHGLLRGILGTWKANFGTATSSTVCSMGRHMPEFVGRSDRIVAYRVGSDVEMFEYSQAVTLLLLVERQAVRCHDIRDRRRRFVIWNPVLECGRDK
jgi:hypothetical protein